MKNTIYMKITTDEYELPLAIADSIGELAKMLGVTKNHISSAISHYKRGTTKSCCYVKVVLDDEEGK